jgi:hypothetical protein
MKSFYKSHTLEVNSQPNGQVIYDVFSRQQHVLTGFVQEGNELEVMESLKGRVDRLIAESPTPYR